MEINFSIIICTYQRPQALLKLLKSVEEQTLYPNQIIIVDGSTNEETKMKVTSSNFTNLEYYLVTTNDRGLTKQRNFGIEKLDTNNSVSCFLDDDVVLVSDYFENLIKTYQKFPEALGVGGYIVEENIDWSRQINNNIKFDDFEFDGWRRKLGSRNVLRKKLGLLSDQPPGIMPKFSHGFSIGFLPPSGKTYPVEFFMGCAMSFKTEVFSRIQFSEYFEGYGLYEDMDFCLRLSKIGNLYVNTAAKLFHYHEPSGRPNQFKYGKMVVKNGWYVWRIKNSKPSWEVTYKWYKIAYLLTFVRFVNVISTSKKREAFTEFLGRFWALITIKFIS